MGLVGRVLEPRLLSQTVVNDGRHAMEIISVSLTVGAFATWRAVNEWLHESGADEAKRYTEMRLRSQGFVEPATEKVDTWADSFCRAVGGEGFKKLNDFDVMLGGSEIVSDSTDGVVYFRQTLNVQNSSDQPMTYHIWPVLGLRVKGDLSLTGAAIMSGARIDLNVPASGKAHAEYREYYPRSERENLTIFSWDSSVNPELIALALPAGPRVEPASCVQYWHDPADPQMAKFYLYLRRAGGVASRQFEGMTGEAKYSLPTLPGAPVFLNWNSPPAQVIVDESYIAKDPGARPTGLLSLAKTTDRSEALSVFDDHVRAIKAICGTTAGVLQERADKNGELRLEIKHLTTFSSAHLDFWVDHDDKHPNAPPVYRVTWLVQEQSR